MPGRIHAVSEPVEGPAGDLAGLLRRFQDDPAGAAPAVHDAFADDVHRIVWRALGQDPEHDDVVQDAFIHILKGLHRVRDPGRMRSWICSVA